MNKLGKAAVALTMVFTGGAAGAADRYVSAEKDYGSGPNGEVMEGDLLYDTIQGAIDKAEVGDTVWVKDGFVCETGAILTDDPVFASMQKDIDGNPRFGEKNGEPMIDMGCCQYAQLGLLMLVK